VPVRVLGEEDVRAAIDMAACIEVCERAFASYSSGGAETPSVIHLEVPESDGVVHIKAGHIHGEPYYAMKAASGFYKADPPALDGLVVVFDGADGSPAAFLLERGYLTNLRTGAAGGVAAKHLARTQVDTVAVIGTGDQARFQLDGLAAVRPGFSSVRVWGRSTDHAEACVADLRERPGLPEGCRYEVSPSVAEAVEGAQVVIACTASTTPLVGAAMVGPGMLVIALGSDGPGKQELDPLILERADLLVVDSRDQCLHLGELQHAPFLSGRAVELGEICGGRPGRSGEDQLVVCDLTGLGVQDVAAANAVMARAEGLGGKIET
jgi:ornithine cyclodeaminase